MEKEVKDIELNNKKTKKENKSNNMKSRLHGQTAFYFKLPMYFGIFMVFIDILVFRQDIKMGLVLGGAIAIYLILCFAFFCFSMFRYLLDLVVFFLFFS